MFQAFPLKMVPPRISAPRNKIRNTKNKIFAIEAAPLAIPVNPKIAATIAIIRKVADHFNIAINYLSSESYLN
jgi:hypothetical protein